MPEPILLVESLCKKYDTTEAVRGISFQVQLGEFFGLLGPNGAGKTTTIGMLTGLIEPTGGRITIGGLDLFSKSLEAKGKIGLVPQSFAFYPSLTARENLTFFGRLYGLKGKHLEERMSQVLEVVSLEDRAHQVVATFSNGMKRRLNIAIGFLHDPEILILDEPTVGIDTQSRNAILESLKGLNLRGVTVLYTTHYIEEAQELCSRVAIMDQGKIIALDLPRSLIQSYGKGIIRMELETAIDERLLGEMERFGKARWADGNLQRIHLETDRTDTMLRQLLDYKETGRLRIKNLDVLEPNLETVFIHLTGKDIRD